jgi:hypothetical protein
MHCVCWLLSSPLPSTATLALGMVNLSCKGKKQQQITALSVMSGSCGQILLQLVRLVCM